MIVASNGMLTGGRVVSHLRNLIDDPDATILFVGYQGEGTLGAHLQAGETEVKIDGQPRDVRCQIRSISGFSAHADENELLEWLGLRVGQAAGRRGLSPPGLPRPRRPGGPDRHRTEGPRRSASRRTSRTGASASPSTDRDPMVASIGATRTAYPGARTTVWPTRRQPFGVTSPVIAVPAHPPRVGDGTQGASGGMVEHCSEHRSGPGRFTLAEQRPRWPRPRER